MAEFVGIDPDGARQLITRMESAKTILGVARPSLEAAIGEAGPDWAGVQGTLAMHKAWAFFDDSQRDLKWRITTITRLVDSGIAERDGALLTSRFPFANEAESAKAGQAAGMAVNDALQGHLGDMSPDTWKKVEAAIADVGQGVHDPAFAAGLLNAIGPTSFRLLFAQWTNVNATSPARGPSPELIKRARPSLGLLAKAFATADTDKRLGGQWHKELLEKANPATLSAMLALARQSSDFLNKAGSALLALPSAGLNPKSPFADWNTHWLIKAYDENPQALQTLLATSPQAARQLFRHELVKRTDTPDFEKILASALDKALSTKTGDAATRDKAWFNLINGLGYKGAENLDGAYAALQNSPVNEAIAKNIGPYVKDLAFGQARAGSPKLAGYFPSPAPWNGLDPDVASRFVGALMQDRDAIKILQKEFRDYVHSLDIGKTHPYSSDDATRAQYVLNSASAGGLANLLLGGSTYAELNNDQFAELVADIATLPVDYLVNRQNVGSNVATGEGFAVNIPKKAIADKIKSYIDKTTPDTAESVAEDLVDEQLQWLNMSLERHGQKPLTAFDQDQIRSALLGRLFPALVEALKARGG